MTPSDPQERHLMELLSALADESLTDAQLQELDVLLKNDAGMRKQYLQYVDMHEHLSELVVPIPTANGEKMEARLVHPWRIYALVAVVTLLLSLTLQRVVWKRELGHPTTDTTVQTQTQPYIATLKRSMNCQWQGQTIPEGMRLLPGPLSLSSGDAEIIFDCGAAVLMKGPAHVVLENQTAMVLQKGEIFFQSDDSIEAFDLKTPRAVHINHGTEYSVKVTQSSEEVHVFDGKVSRHAENGHVDRLGRGQAVAYPPSQARGRQIELGKNQWLQQRLTPPRQGHNVTEELVAYDRFQYTNPLAITSKIALAGKGWKGSWWGFSRTLDEDPIDDLPLIDPSVGIGGDAGCMRVPPGRVTGSYRSLADPIRMDEPGVYYLSLLFQFSRPKQQQDDLYHAINAFVVQLHPGYHDDILDHRIEMGIHVDTDTVFTRYNHMRNDRGSLPLLEEQTYLLVGKIVANRSYTDQMFVSIFDISEPLPAYEPHEWALKGLPFDSDLEYGRVVLHVNTRYYQQQLDDVRIGKTWSSVTLPLAGVQ